MLRRNSYDPLQPIIAQHSFPNPDDRLRDWPTSDEERVRYGRHVYLHVEKAHRSTPGNKSWKDYDWTTAVERSYRRVATQADVRC